MVLCQVVGVGVQALKIKGGEVLLKAVRSDGVGCKQRQKERDREEIRAAF